MSDKTTTPTPNPDDDDEPFDASTMKTHKWSELTEEQRKGIEKQFPH